MGKGMGVGTAGMGFLPGGGMWTGPGSRSVGVDLGPSSMGGGMGIRPGSMDERMAVSHAGVGGTCGNGLGAMSGGRMAMGAKSMAGGGIGMGFRSLRGGVGPAPSMGSRNS